MKNSLKTYTYAWEGINRRGEHVYGEVTATSITIAKADLRRQGVIPKKVRKRSNFSFLNRRRKIRAKDIAYFSRQLATMLNAGIPLVQCFDIIARGSDNSSFKKLIQTIRTDVENGASLAEALQKHPRTFNELYTSLIFAGEQSGTLDTMLEKIAVYREKIESIKGKIKKAMFYPTAVLVIAVIITIGLLLFVVPQFEVMFKSFGANLPFLTRTVIRFSEIMQSIWWMIILFSGAFVYVFTKMLQKNVKFRERVERYTLKIPIIGAILHKAAIARFSRTLAITFAAGIPVVDALKSVAGATGNSLYVKATLKIRDQVSSGQSLQNSLKQVELFPHMVVQMIAIGEEAGNLELMLTKVADYFEEEVDNAVESLSSLIEPMIMVVLGVLIGGLVIAMYLPIFKMGSVI